MPKTLDFYFDLMRPYSYPAARKGSRPPTFFADDEMFADHERLELFERALSA